MKKNRLPLLAVLFLSLAILLPAGSILAAEAPGFTIKQMVVCEKIVNREPIGISDSFPFSTKKVWCFLDARDIEQDTEVTFVWYSHQTVKARVTLPLKKGSRWRTKSSKKMVGLRGPWKVELQDTAGRVLDSISFWLE